MTGGYRVACIGASRMGSWFDDIQLERATRDGGRSREWVPGAMASVCQAIDRAELVAVCDLKPELVEKMQQRWQIPAGYTDWREMVAREKPDIVAIVTSWGRTHAELAAGVAETGLVRGIYCEKPISTSMQEADRIVAACRQHSVAYTCAHVFRWNARYQQGQTWIRDGAIGEVRSVVCNGMSSLMHSGTHQTDAAIGLAGDPEVEWATGWVDVDPAIPQAQWPKHDPAGGGLVQLAGGAQLFFDGRAAGPRVFQVNGTLGKVYLFNDLRQVQLWRKSDEPGVSDLLPGPLESPEQQKSYAVTQMEELIQVLDQGGRTSCDDIRSARALEMALGFHLSHRRGGARVSFPLDDRAFGVDTA